MVPVVNLLIMTFLQAAKMETFGVVSLYLPLHIGVADMLILGPSNPWTFRMECRLSGMRCTIHTITIKGPVFHVV